MKEATHFSKIQCVAIVGVGLIGGSIGRAILSRGLAEKVIGVGRNHDRLQLAIGESAVTEVTLDFDAAVSVADVVIICTPVNSVVQFVKQAIACGKPSAFITDVGSTKETIVQQMHADLGDDHPFVASHPMAGGEKTGVQYADPDLFVNRPTIVTPSEHTARSVIDRCTAFWEALGSKVTLMPANEHDQLVAAISHMPHMMASIIAAATEPSELKYCSTGWLDTTRVASGDIDLWMQILGQNRNNVLDALLKIRDQLSEFIGALQEGNDEAIVKILKEGKEKRDAVAS